MATLRRTPLDDGDIDIDDGALECLPDRHRLLMTETTNLFIREHAGHACSSRSLKHLPD